MVVQSFAEFKSAFAVGVNPRRAPRFVLAVQQAHPIRVALDFDLLLELMAIIQS